MKAENNSTATSTTPLSPFSGVSTSSTMTAMLARSQMARSITKATARSLSEASSTESGTPSGVTIWRCARRFGRRN